MNNSNINVEIDALTSSASKISELVELIEEDIKKATEAGAAALDSLGGELTPAGKALKGKMIDINDSEFEKTKNSIKNFLDSITNVSKTYQSAENDFVNMINQYASNSSTNS